MKLVFASSEVVPFAKTGGLADVSGALPIELKKQGIDIIVFLPYYRMAKKNIEKLNLNPELIDKVIVQTEEGKEEADIYKVEYKGVEFYLIDNPRYYDRDELYIDPVVKSDYPDNLKRFAFFSKAVLESLKVIDFKPNLIHVNDWQTSLIPVYLKTIYSSDNFFIKTKTLLTIHNLAYQGIFPVEQYPILGLDWKYFTLNGLEFYGHINLLKGGIIFSDYVSTVSETYAKEIQTPELGSGLDGVLRQKAEQGKLTGIVNGVDYDEWDPRNDPFIKEAYGINYDEKTIEKKNEIKKLFLKEIGLLKNENAVNTMLIGIVSRLVDQKGFDLVYEILEDLLTKENVMMVVLGTGKKEYEAKFVEAMSRFPEKVWVKIGFDIPLSHKIEAASDAFLMPSRFEPCGLNQMYSLRYGTLPIVRAVGGLEDTVKDGVTGFKFKEYKPEALYETIKRALNVYYNEPKKWREMQINAMKEDWSWSSSAKKYINLYNTICAE